MARRAAPSAAICAAKGVLLREPLKFAVPALPQLRTFPLGSVSVMIVLLNVLLMYALPRGTDLRSRRRVRCCRLETMLSAPLAYFLVALRLPATVRRAPRLVRALVLVRCPRTGRPRRWRMPR